MLIVPRENYSTTPKELNKKKQSGIVAIDSCFALSFGDRQYGVTTKESSDEKYPSTLI